MSERPQLSELRAGAALLVGNGSSSPCSLTIEQLEYHGITSLALNAGNLPDVLSRKLHAHQAMMVANEALKTHALVSLHGAFAAANLSPLVFKGSALAHLIYSKPWLRPRTDTDLFIDQSQLDQCKMVFAQLGYEKLFAIEGETVTYQATYSKALTDKVALNIDLHWRINNRQILANSFSYAELLGRSKTIKAIGFSTPLQYDHLLIACLHRLGHHQREERLAWLYDIHLLASDLQDADWALLVKQAEHKQLAAITLDALLLCRDLLHTQIPPSVLEGLTQASHQAEPSAIFLQRDLPEWRIAWHELAAMPSWRQRVKWLQETLFPSNKYLRERMGTHSLVLAYSKRWWRGLRRITHR